MRVFMSEISHRALSALLMATAISIFAVAGMAQSQAAAADLSGTVTDPTGAVVSGATVTARGVGTGISRTVTTDAEGNYQILNLPPGEYEITAEGTTFKKSVISGVKLTVGQSAELTVKLEIGEASAIVNVSGDDVQLVETSRSSVSNTIDQARIQSLPINERSATGFALTLSTVGRDNGRPIGPAPTSGLNVGGQRGRSTQVNVDGADFTDNSINAARSTVSMEAVQEYQVSTNSYNAEFGRATGGVINVVTKRGTNAFHGNIFGYLRDKNIQARNAFAPIAKPDYRRTQYGGTLGGPLVKDTMFFFFAFERRQRDESGFFTSAVNQGLSAVVPLTVPGLPAQNFANITPAQAAFAAGLLGVPATQSLGINYLYLTSSGGFTALTGTNPLISAGGAIPAGTVIGTRFLISGQPVPVSQIAFRPLNALQRVFPITDRTNFSSFRFDQNLNANNQFIFRFGYNTGNLTGIQVESQNQSLGQNDFSRTGITNFIDTSVSAGLNTTLSGTTTNEFRFNFGKRRAVFRSQNGDAVAYNISGTAFIGRELFSPVNRDETRFNFADNYNWVVGNHTFKFGGDYSAVNIPNANFELNFAGLFNFGQFPAANIICASATGAALTACNAALAGAPDFTPVQAYGLGLPSLFVQGFGDPVSKLNNKPMAIYAQDSWKLLKTLTVNYGVRYDYEITKQIAPTAFRDPLTGITLTAADLLAAQDVLGVQQGFPRDKNNWAPRLGFAWDVFGDQKTKISGSYGLYYDHPLLAVGFNSDIADAAQQQQAVLTPGSPAPSSATVYSIIIAGVPTPNTFNSANLVNATQVFHGTVFPGLTPGVATSAQYQTGRQRFNDQTFPGFGAVLPFTLPVAKDFQYASALQGNFTVERQISRNMVLSASYIHVAAHHLPRPTDLNTPNVANQIGNFTRFAGRAPATTTEALLGIGIPSGTSTTGTVITPGTAFVNTYGVTCAVVIPGMIAQCPTGRVIVPAIANFFRPNAPNYFLAQALSGGAVTKAVLDSQLAGSLRTAGTLSPFGSVNAQLSDGNSSYNAMKVELNRRYADNFLFLASYTWSHSIDDSSDLQTLLIPQNVNRFDLEKANSLFDQRHRFVFSGAMNSPAAWRTGSGWQKFFADFTVAPIFEISSGRPFNIITNVDTNNDQSTQTDRPSVNSSGALTLPTAFTTGSLGRNMGMTHGYMSFDLGVTKALRFSERWHIDLIAQGFNLFNRFNEASASPLFTDVNAFGQRAGNGRYFSRPTAAFDSRQFQLGAKLIF